MAKPEEHVLDEGLHPSEQILAMIGEGDLDAALTGEDVPPEQDSGIPADEADAPDIELVDDDGDTGEDEMVEPTDDDEHEIEAADEDDDEESGDGDDTSYDMPELLEVRATDNGHEFGMEIDGEFHTLDDLRRGNLREADYTRKTQELAELRRQASEAREEFLERAGQHVTLMDAVEANLEDAVQAVLGNRSEAEWAQLLQSDPARYQEEKKALATAQSDFAQLRAHREKVENERNAELAQTLRARQERCQAELMEAIPEWSDRDTLTKDATELTDLLDTRYGFTEDERAVTTDSRVWRLAYDALQYHRIQQAGERAKANGKKKSAPTLKAGKSETKGEKAQRRSRKVTAARKRLKATGSIEDGERAVFEMLERHGGL